MRDKEKERDRKKVWYEANKERLKAKSKSYYEANKEKLKAYYESNKEKLNTQSKAHYEANKEKRKAQNKEYREANREKRKAQNKAYREANRERLNAYLNQRRAKDPFLKMKCNLRVRTSQAFRNGGYKKNTKTAETLGAEFQEVFDHLENLFTEGMEWSNQGEWHIDHIIPLASANTKEELIALCHYTNLQPLWAEDNLSKGSKLNWNKS